MFSASARAMPAYTAALASRYLDIPTATIRAWFFGMSYKGGRFSPILSPADEQNKLLSFENLAEAYIYRLMRTRQVEPKKIREALCKVGEELGCSRPLLHKQFLTDGANVFIETAFGPKCITSKQLFFDWHTESLERVEWADSTFARFYPVTWLSATTVESLSVAPKSVLIDPEFGFGATVIASRRVPTKVIADRYFGGEDIALLVEDFCCATVDIEEAIRSEWKFSRGSRAA